MGTRVNRGIRVNMISWILHRDNTAVDELHAEFDKKDNPNQLYRSFLMAKHRQLAWMPWIKWGGLQLLGLLTLIAIMGWAALPFSDPSVDPTAIDCVWLILASVVTFVGMLVFTKYSHQSYFRMLADPANRA